MKTIESTQKKLHQYKSEENKEKLSEWDAIVGDDVIPNLLFQMSGNIREYKDWFRKCKVQKFCEKIAKWQKS